MPLSCLDTRRHFLKQAGMAGVFWATPLFANVATQNSWNAVQLLKMNKAALRYNPQGWAAWQNDRQVVGWNPKTRGPTLSITKSLAALAVARAMGEGWLKIHEKITETFAEWRGDSRKSRLTVLMLLQQTSGLESGAMKLYNQKPADKGRAALALKVIDEPETVFRYGPANWEILAELLQRKLIARKSSLDEFMRSKVLKPLHLTSPRWRKDQRGVPYLSTGCELNAEELGRLGQSLILLLRGKNTAGIKAADFAEAIRPSAVNPMFGGGLWRNAPVPTITIEVESALNDAQNPPWRFGGLSKEQPADFVALIGSGGRRLFLWPGDHKIIARLGSSHSWSDREFLDVC